MTAVAILGVLAMLAVPQYQVYTARSLQAEAKAELAAIYMIEKGYTVQESTFSACLGNIGYARTTGTRNYYAHGFAAFNGASGCGPTGLQTCGGYTWNADGTPFATCLISDGTTFFSANAGIGSVVSPGALTTSIDTHVNTRTTFVAGACGDISKRGVIDCWTMDQSKTLVNAPSGI